MRRLGAGLLIVLLVAGMNVRSVWSGGGKWGSGTPSGARTDAYWLPDGQTPTGRPFPDVAIGGTLYTTSLQSATWSLGISDFLADLSPNTASLSFVGQISGVPGDDVVISTGLGVAWSGRLDTVTQTRDTAGDWWTTITATDRLGALGAATIVAQDVAGGTLETIGEDVAALAGITLDIQDDSTNGLATLFGWSTHGLASTFDGTVMDYIKAAQRSSNAMLALQRDGTISAVVREARVGKGINGDFEVDTTGWSAYLSGSIARSTSSPITGTASGRITSGTTQFGGSVLDLSGPRFLEGRTYRFTFQAKSISGNTGWYVEPFSSDGGSTTQLFTVSGTAATFTVDWTPTADTSSAELYIGNMNTTSSVIDIDDLAIAEAPALTMTGANAPQSWSEQTSLDVVVNRFVARWDDGTLVLDTSDVGSGSSDADCIASVAVYGERGFEVRPHLSATYSMFDDWIAYGGAYRDTVSGAQFVVSAWTQDDLILLDPFQWVTESGTDWQVMSVQHNVTASPYSWTVSITADNLLDLL